MQELGSELGTFLRGEMDLDGLLAVIDRMPIDNPGSIPDFRQQLHDLRDSGRLPPQLCSILERRIASAPPQSDLSSPSVSSPAAADARPLSPDGPTVIVPAGHLREPGSSGWKTGGSRGRPGASGDALAGQDLKATVAMSAPNASHANVLFPSGEASRTGGDSRYPSRSRSSWSGIGSDGSFTDPTEYPAESGEPGVGQILNGRFELMALLGRGGMSVVFKALDRRKAEALDRNPYVALKLLNAKFKRHPESLKTLQREARKAQGLKHPNVISIYDFDKDEAGNYFIAMEILSGSPLDEVLRERRKNKDGGMAPREAYRLIEQMGGALAVAHKQKPPIVHSDFKPGNVFITEAGEVKVFDFGIARAAHSAEGEAGEATNFDAGVLGALTPNYASPEMLAGLEPDPRDDIYALAIVAYELFSGHRPFGKRSAMEAIAKGIRLRRIKTLTRRQWKGLERALAFKRGKRTPTVERFLEDLRCRRSMLPLYAAAGLVATGLGLWFFVADPLLKQQRGDALLQEASVADLDRLPVVVVSAVDVPAGTRDRIYVRVAGRLLETINEGTPEEVAAALDTVRGLPQPVRVPIYAGLEELLLERMLGTDGRAAAAAVDLAGKLPPTVANHIFSAAASRLVEAFAEAGEQEIAALIETARMFPPARRRNIYARSREPILHHFSTAARRSFFPEEGRYDFASAQAMLQRAADLYPDSKTLGDAKLALETARDETWSRLASDWERFASAGLFLPLDNTPDTVPGVLARMQQLDPDAFPAMADRLVPLYLEQVRKARGQGDPNLARRYLSTALKIFPEHGQLRRERVAMDLAQERDYRAQTGETAKQPVEDVHDEAERDRLDREQAERERAERLAGEERKRLERERAEQERAAQLVREERERLEREQAERERRQVEKRRAREQEAQRRERHDTALQYWKLIQNTSDVAILRGFIDGFPDDPVLTPLARKRLSGLEDWTRIEDSGDKAQLEDFLQRYSDDPVLMPMARSRLEALRGAAPAIAESADRPGPGSDRDTAERALARAAELPSHMIQQALKDLGHYGGTVDGQAGPGTRKAIRAFQKAQGHAQSGELSNAERVALIRGAAEAGHPESQNTFAQMAAEGVGIPKELALAVHWFQASADRGSAYAAYNLGVLYREGRGVEQSPDLARRYFRAALAGGHPAAAAALKDLPAAGADDAGTQAALARIGELPAQLIQQALKDLGFLKGAADGVVGPGTRRAVRAYQGSRGLQQSGTLDDAETVALIVQAAEAGHARSQNTLGMMVAEGVGVVKDPQEAFHWFSSAAEKGDAYAAYNLGVVYRDGVGVDKSISDARKYFKSARAGGHPQAARALADLDR